MRNALCKFKTYLLTDLLTVILLRKCYILSVTDFNSITFNFLSHLFELTFPILVNNMTKIIIGLLITLVLYNISYIYCFTLYTSCFLTAFIKRILYCIVKILILNFAVVYVYTYVTWYVKWITT